MKGMKTNLILLLLLGVVVVIFFWDREVTQEQEAQKERERQLTLLEPNEVERVKIGHRLEDIVAEKRESGWHLIEPVNYPGDQSAWDDVVNAIARGQLQRVLVQNPEELSVYGLENPQIEVTLYGTKPAAPPKQKTPKSVTSTIAFGNETPLAAGKYYALIKNSSDVVTVMTSVYNTVDKNLHAFRDKTVLALETSQVQKAKIENASMSVVVQRNGDTWNIVEPVAGRANGTLIEDLINQVANSEVKQFIEEDLREENYVAYGLINPATKLTFWSGEPDNQASWSAQALLLGATNPSNYVYAKREAQSNVIALEPKDLNKIPRTLDELRLRQITPIKSWSLQRVMLSAGDTVYEVSKSGGDWFMKQPQEGQAAYNDVNSLNRKITGLEIDEFLETPPESVNFATPAVRITLQSDQDQETLVFADPNEGGYYIGKRENPTEFYKIERSHIDQIIYDANAVQLDQGDDSIEAASPAVESSPIDAAIQSENLPDNLPENFLEGQSDN